MGRFRRQWTVDEKYRIPVIHEPVRGEDWRERHLRRQALAVENWPGIKAWCQYRGIDHRLLRDGHDVATFKFKIPLHKSAAAAVWLPLKGRMMWTPDACRAPMRYAKVHDYVQLLRELEAWLCEIDRCRLA